MSFKWKQKSFGINYIQYQVVAVTRQIVCVAGILRGRKGGKKGEGIGKGCLLYTSDAATTPYV